MPKLSVTVITKNEAADIAAALDSVRWADEIIVVDSGSSDATTTIASRYTDRVVVRAWQGYADQKNAAALLATHDWILSVDADERVPQELATEIQARLEQPPTHTAFRMPRVTWHLGRWIRTTDWYPDYQVRLYNRTHAHWTGGRVHEGVAVTGSLGTLSNELQHYPYRDIAEHVETIDRYTTLAAQTLHERGTRAGWLHLTGHAPLAFLRNYVLRGGFRDGQVGFIISTMNAYYVFLKFAKLWELQRAATRARQG